MKTKFFKNGILLIVGIFLGVILTRIALLIKDFDSNTLLCSCELVTDQKVLDSLNFSKEVAIPWCPPYKLEKKKCKGVVRNMLIPRNKIYEEYISDSLAGSLGSPYYFKVRDNHFDDKNEKICACFCTK